MASALRRQGCPAGQQRPLRRCARSQRSYGSEDARQANKCRFADVHAASTLAAARTSGGLAKEGTQMYARPVQ